jgi:hypothetical protein
LPGAYTVVRWNGAFARRPERPVQADERVNGQVAVWNDVWRKRVNYFATVAVSIVLALVPIVEQRTSLMEAGVIADAQQLVMPLVWWLPPLIELAGWFVPEVAHFWIHSFAANPVVFLVLVVVLAALLLRGGALQRRIRDRMYYLWRSQHGQPANPPSTGWAERWIQAVRTHAVYQTVLQNLKWRVVPFVFGVSTLLALLAAGVVVVVGARL